VKSFRELFRKIEVDDEAYEPVASKRDWELLMDSQPWKDLEAVLVEQLVATRDLLEGVAVDEDMSQKDRLYNQALCAVIRQFLLIPVERIEMLEFERMEKENGEAGR